jgi:uncharacterized protein (UPF0262 family)
VLTAILLEDWVWEKAPEARRQEWRLAIRELVDEHSFALTESPLILRVAFTDEAVTMRWESPGKGEVAAATIVRKELEQTIDEYVRICRDMVALGTGEAAKLSSLDLLKKKVHDEGAKIIARNAAAAGPGHETARRFFTLLVTLLVDTTTLRVLQRPHMEG